MDNDAGVRKYVFFTNERFEYFIYCAPFIDGRSPSGSSETGYRQATLVIHVNKQYSAVMLPRKASTEMKCESGLTDTPFEIDDAYTFGHAMLLASIVEPHRDSRFLRLYQMISPLVLDEAQHLDFNGLEECRGVMLESLDTDS